MSSFEKQGLDEDAFGEKSGLSGLQTFDAFPKTKATYTSATARGGQWTIIVALFCFVLTASELRTWWSGTETHHFSVERGIGHELQMNLDIIVAMPCQDLHVNVQDAAMDRIVAGELLTKEETNWGVWIRKPPKSHDSKGYGTLHDGSDLKRKRAEEEDSHVGHVLNHIRDNPSRKFVKTPRLKRNEPANACRIYGSLEGNKVQGDFHITARGHGYQESPGVIGHGAVRGHLDHNRFNFSHFINELSFGPHYPNLLNPLDRTSDTTDRPFFKFQYYLSIVPTIFTKRKVSTESGALDPAAIPQPATLDLQPDLKRRSKDDSPVKHISNPNAGKDSQSVFTNQYAATSQSREVSSHNNVPGVFFKYDIEPILLVVSEQRSGFLGLVVRLVNVISGVLVGGGWLFQIHEWLFEIVRRRRRNSGGGNLGVLHGRAASRDWKDG